MTKKYVRTLVACLGFWSGLSYGTEVDVSTLPDALETRLRACCEATGHPESYADARRRIDGFIGEIGNKGTTLGQMALLEEKFQLPGWFALDLTTRYGNKATESANILKSIEEYIQAYEFNPHVSMTQTLENFLKHIAMTKTHFDSLSSLEKIECFDRYREEKVDYAMKRLEHGVPQMVRDAAFYLFNQHRESAHFPLLYYSFMVRPYSARQDWWVTLVAWRSCGSLGSAFETYPDLFDALMNLPHAPFPFPGESQISPVTASSS